MMPGEKNAGNVWPRRMFFKPSVRSARKTAIVFCSYQESTKETGSLSRVRIPSARWSSMAMRMME